MLRPGCGARHRPGGLVANEWGQAHEVKNLFFSDGSVFTTGGAENPTLTIVTLAICQPEYSAGEMGRQSLRVLRIACAPGRFCPEAFPGLPPSRPGAVSNRPRPPGGGYQVGRGCDNTDAIVPSVFRHNRESRHRGSETREPLAAVQGEGGGDRGSGRISRPAGRRCAALAGRWMTRSHAPPPVSVSSCASGRFGGPIPIPKLAFYKFILCEIDR